MIRAAHQPVSDYYAAIELQNALAGFDEPHDAEKYLKRLSASAKTANLLKKARAASRRLALFLRARNAHVIDVPDDDDECGVPAKRQKVAPSAVADTDDDDGTQPYDAWEATHHYYKYELNTGFSGRTWPSTSSSSRAAPHVQLTLPTNVFTDIMPTTLHVQHKHDEIIEHVD